MPIVLGPIMLRLSPPQPTPSPATTTIAVNRPDTHLILYLRRSQHLEAQNHPSVLVLEVVALEDVQPGMMLEAERLIVLASCLKEQHMACHA
jgi:hypothetical protein